MTRYRFVLAGLCLALGACSTPEIRHVGQDIRRADSSTSAQMAALRNEREPYYSEVDQIWLGSQPLDAATKHEPAWLGEQVTYAHQYPVTLTMLAEYLSTTFGASVTATQDALQAAADANFNPVNAMQQEQGGQATQPAPSGSTIAAGAFDLQYQGTARGLLNEACAHTATGWKIQSDGSIVIFGLDTRTFTIDTIPTKSALTSTISNTSTSGATTGGGGGGGGGGSGAQAQSSTQNTITGGQTTTVTTEIESVKAAEAVVKSMLSSKGKVAVLESASAVTVTDTPAVLTRVAEYIEQLNRRLARQVVVDVHVYSVQLNRTEDYGIDWQLVWRNIAGRYKIMTQSNPQAAQNAASLNFSVIDPTNTYSGTNVLFTALSEQGNVSIKTSSAVATLSGQPAPVQIAQQTTYLAERNSTLVANAGTQTSSVPGSVTTGFTMNVLPVVIEGNDILLQVQLNLSTLQSLRQIGTGDNQIEAPNVDSRQFMQQVKLHSGETVVLSGFEQDTLNNDDRGVGKPKWTLLGGSRNSSNGHTVLVVTLTPRVTS